MQKRYRYFVIAAGCIILLCGILYIVFGRQRQQDALPTNTTATGTVSESATTQNTEPEETTSAATVETNPPIIISEDVTIQQVEKNPNETIDHTQAIPESDPEYIPGMESYYNAEGKVCRNDKTISIDVFDDVNGQFYTITLGYITGECNRFLYLNPVVEKNDLPVLAYIHYDSPIGGGFMTTINDSPTNQNKISYTYPRALEQKTVAAYKDSQNPGWVWFPGGILNGPIYINMIVQDFDLSMIATLRLTIDKAEDGTYSIVDIDNNDLCYDNSAHPEYTNEELAYIVQLAGEAYMDRTVCGFFVQNTKPFTVDYCIVEYRDQTTGLYHQQFIPRVGADESYTQVYVDMRMPILAVTYWQGGIPSVTLYLQVTRSPQDGEHGTYTYIGIDYPLFQTTSVLRGYGWEGGT